jgi:nucleoid-associated protein EbfC
VALKGFGNKGGGGGMGGFGGLGNMAGLMGQLQEAQKKIREDGEKMQETLENARLEGAAGGVVKAVVNGHGDLIELSLSPEAVDPSDVSGLTELIVTAVGQAQDKAADLREEEQKKLLPAGLNIPGLF